MRLAASRSIVVCARARANVACDDEPSMPCSRFVSVSPSLFRHSFLRNPPRFSLRSQTHAAFPHVASAFLEGKRKNVTFPRRTNFSRSVPLTLGARHRTCHKFPFSPFRQRCIFESFIYRNICCDKLQRRHFIRLSTLSLFLSVEFFFYFRIFASSCRGIVCPAEGPLENAHAHAEKP